MPVLDGFKTASLLRSSHKDGSNPVIIAVTASAMESDRELCLQSGMNDILTKPFSRDELIATIRRNIKSSPAINQQSV
jgi:CheY-like chemotaxis protein